METKTNKTTNVSFKKSLLSAAVTVKKRYNTIKETFDSFSKVTSKINGNVENFSFNKEVISTLCVIDGKLQLAFNNNELVLSNETITKKAVAQIKEYADSLSITAKKSFTPTDYIVKYEQEETKTSDTKETEAPKPKKTKTTSTKSVNKSATVELVVKLACHLTTDEVYVLGNVKELGEWDFNNAIQLEKVSNNTFKTTFKVAKNTYVEFKFSKDKSWLGVEKGMFNEEIVNHSYLIESDKVVETIIYNFS